MKIRKLILENFSNIYTALESKKIELDFSKSNNNVIMLIGPNGSGKTSILSLLTPFSSLGNLDIRDGVDLILENKNGYKEINIQNNGSIYIIKHFYSPSKTSHSVKSYIEKDGKELNVNGNVTSFKEIVKDELHVDLDYLKLIRIGNNVTSLIDLTDTERKNYMSKIMEDIDLWLGLYKKVNTDFRQLKDMISRNISKINRLNIASEDDLKEEIKRIEKHINDTKHVYDELYGEMSIIKRDIASLEDGSDIKLALQEITKKYKKMCKLLEKSSDHESKSVEFYESRITCLNNTVVETREQIKSSSSILESYVEQLNRFYEQQHAYQVQFEKELDSDKELSSMEKEYEKILKEIHKLQKDIGNFHPEYSKDEFDGFVVFLKNAQQSFEKAYDNGSEVMRKLVDLMRNKRNIMSYVNSHIAQLDPDSFDRSSIFLNRLKERFTFRDYDINCPTKSNCDAYKLYVQISNIIRGNNENEEEKKGIEFYQGIEIAYQEIMSVIPLFSSYKKIIENLPDKIKKSFQTETLFSRMEAQEIIYNEKDIHSLLSLVTDYYIIQDLKIEAESLRHDIERFSRMSNLDYVKKQLVETTNSIDEYKIRITDMREKITHLRETLFQLENDLESSKDLKETLEKFDDVSSRYTELRKKYEFYTTRIDELQSIEMKKSKVEKLLTDYRNQLQQKYSILTQYKEMKRELSIYNIAYDEMSLLRDSLSSKGGIPIYYIQKYFDEIQESTNELLDIVCDGDLYIDRFNITANEFTIPFFRKGKLLKDVKLASQGELSLFKIALAFAISSKDLSDYNIILMDEINGALDKIYSEKFLLLVEEQRQRTGAEQIFLISHKDIGASYPIDIIDLTDRSNSGILKIY